MQNKYKYYFNNTSGCVIKCPINTKPKPTPPRPTPTSLTEFPKEIISYDKDPNLWLQCPYLNKYTFTNCKHYKADSNGIVSEETIPIAQGESDYNLLYFIGTSSNDESDISDLDLSNGSEFRASTLIGPAYLHANVYTPIFNTFTNLWLSNLLTGNASILDATDVIPEITNIIEAFVKMSKEQGKKIILSGTSQGSLYMSYIINNNLIKPDEISGLYLTGLFSENFLKAVGMFIKNVTNVLDFTLLDEKIKELDDNGVKMIIINSESTEYPGKLLGSLNTNITIPDSYANNVKKQLLSNLVPTEIIPILTLLKTNGHNNYYDNILNTLKNIQNDYNSVKNSNYISFLEMTNSPFLIYTYENKLMLELDKTHPLHFEIQDQETMIEYDLITLGGINQPKGWGLHGLDTMISCTYIKTFLDSLK